MYDTLQSAIFSGWADGTDLSAVERLLDDGHDVDEPDVAGDTPLISAALVGSFYDRSEAATRLLLARGADPDRAGPTGRGPLHIAVCTIAEGTVRALLEGGADPDRPSDDGASPVHHALSELRRAARGRGDFTDPETAAGTAAAFVAAHLRALAAHGADLNRPSPAGDPPLAMAACIPRCPDTVLDALLDGGADPRGVTVEAEGVPVDLLAATLFSELSPHIACRFVDAGCPWDVPYAPFADRPFIDVVGMFRPDIAYALVRHSDSFAAATLARRNDLGHRMLSAAAYAGHEPLMTWLVAHGQDPYEVAEDGRTAIDVARKNQPASVPILERLRSSS